MKKNRKKFVAIFVASLLILTCAIPAFADNDDIASTAKEQTSEQVDENGTTENTIDDTADNTVDEEDNQSAQGAVQNENSDAVVDGVNKVVSKKLSKDIALVNTKTADELTDDELTKFYTYNMQNYEGYMCYSVSISLPFRDQLNKEAGGAFTVGGYTWHTGDPLPNPNPNGMHRINGEPTGLPVGSARFTITGHNFKSLDLSKWDTSTFVNLEDCFNGMTELESVNLQGWDTSKVTNMWGMFQGCSSLTSLDLSSFDTSNVTNMRSMFKSCSSLTNVDVSSFNTGNVTTMSETFANCSSLTSLDVSKWNTSNVADMHGMFFKCSSLPNLDVSNFDTSKSTDIYGMFYMCGKLSSVDVSGWDTSQVTDMTGVFFGCTSLSSVDVSKWDTSQTTNMYGMFKDCSGLTSLDLSSFDTSKVTDMTGMFMGCSGLSDLDLSDFDTSSATKMQLMFSGCKDIQYLDLSNFDIAKVADMKNMFRDCGMVNDKGEPAIGYAIPKALAEKFNSGEGDTAIDTTRLNFVQKVEHTVSFDTEGGSTVADERVITEKPAAAPADPVKEGYTFDGWYEDEAGTIKYDFTERVKGDTVIYAKWIKNEKPDGSGDENKQDKISAGTGATADTSTTTKGHNGPNTGDEANLIMWIVLAMTGAVATGVAMVYTKK